MQIGISNVGKQEKWMPKMVTACRAMTMEQRLKRGLDFTEQARQFKITSARVHHPGWSKEKVMDEVRRWMRNGMNPAELYEWWPPDD